MGEIKQYVRIEDMAWASGLTSGLQHATAEIIKKKHPINPNKCSISIEHEGTDGNLTEAHFQATVWLHRYLREYVLI